MFTPKRNRSQLSSDSFDDRNSGFAEPASSKSRQVLAKCAAQAPRSNKFVDELPPLIGSVRRRKMPAFRRPRECGRSDRDKCAARIRRRWWPARGRCGFAARRRSAIRRPALPALPPSAHRPVWRSLIYAARKYLPCPRCRSQEDSHSCQVPLRRYIQPVVASGQQSERKNPAPGQFEIGVIGKNRSIVFERFDARPDPPRPGNSTHDLPPIVRHLSEYSNLDRKGGILLQTRRTVI